MSGSTGEQKKIKEGPMTVALLDEIAQRLLSIERLYKSEIPEGVVEPIEKFSITETKTHIKRLKRWFSMSLINDGLSSVFVIVNTAKSFDEHEVLSGETYNIDMRHGLIEDLLIWCAHGDVATIRLVGVR